jgi:transcriptional regulator with XRE-family HTH domain
MNSHKKPLPESCRGQHEVMRQNLRRLMDGHESQGRKGIGVIRLAKSAGIGTGSVQSILSDPDHSPSLRVLTQLAAFFGIHVSDLLREQGA